MNIINSYRFAAAGGITDPTNITGCDLWLDASDNSTVLDATDTAASDDEAVKTWQDKSGNANHAVQSTAANQPLRRAAQINGLDALDFDGVFAYMVGTSDLTPRQTSAKTIFLALASDTTVSSDYIFTPYDLVGGTTGSVGGFTPEIAYRCSGRTWISSSPCSTSGANIITLTQSGSGDIHSVISMWLDGASVTRTGGNDGSLADRSCVYIAGGLYSNSQTNAFDGRLCEIIVYDSELSTTDRESVETYLADKWGITL